MFLLAQNHFVLASLPESLFNMVMALVTYCVTYVLVFWVPATIIIIVFGLAYIFLKKYQKQISYVLIGFLLITAGTVTLDIDDIPVEPVTDVLLGWLNTTSSAEEALAILQADEPIFQHFDEKGKFQLGEQGVILSGYLDDSLVRVSVYGSGYTMNFTPELKDYVSSFADGTIEE
ncbi:hypothetical protein [Aureibacillus halotolerans]|uniref:Uncharacterized protein n=1 Tax=Aureibacillus halotolerans TaxID=1508390 RepID=A0A4R6U3I5_9BACI|nr:hypothetical protein [Aureibacillus halotolerans]TDQ37674.1 hypothetical protein EV213_11234 [Aureibacillus halotolerans]